MKHKAWLALSLAVFSLFSLSVLSDQNQILLNRVLDITPEIITPVSGGNRIIITDTGVRFVPAEGIGTMPEIDLSTIKYVERSEVLKELTRLKNLENRFCVGRYIEGIDYREASSNFQEITLGEELLLVKPYKLNYSYKIVTSIDNIKVERSIRKNNQPTPDFLGRITIDPKFEMSETELGSARRYTVNLSVLGDDVPFRAPLEDELLDQYKGDMLTAIRNANWCQLHEPTSILVDLRVKLSIEFYGLDGLVDWAARIASYNFDCFKRGPTKQAVSVESSKIESTSINYLLVAEQKDKHCITKTYCADYKECNLGVDCGGYCAMYGIKQEFEWVELDKKHSQIEFLFGDDIKMMVMGNIDGLENIEIAKKLYKLSVYFPYLKLTDTEFVKDDPRDIYQYQQKFQYLSIKPNDATIVTRLLINSLEGI